MDSAFTNPRLPLAGVGVARGHEVMRSFHGRIPQSRLQLRWTRHSKTETANDKDVFPLFKLIVVLQIELFQNRYFLWIAIRNTEVRKTSFLAIEAGKGSFVGFPFDIFCLRSICRFNFECAYVPGPNVNIERMYVWILFIGLYYLYANQLTFKCCLVFPSDQ